jgi:hypothetical protein
MKIKIFIFVIIFCSIHKLTFAQEGASKGKCLTNNAILVNFLELANAEKLRAKPFEGKQPPVESISKKKEKEIETNNVVTTFSPMQKLQTSLPPSFPSTKNEAINKNIESYPCIDFSGVADNTVGGSFYWPSDANGGVGFDNIFSTTNSNLRVSNKQGGIISEQSFQSFFSALGVTDVFDPKIHYDSYAHKWVFVGAATRQSANSSFIIAISQTENATGNWWLYAIDADAANTNWYDYPEVGINKNWIVITGNMFTIAGDNFSYSRVWAINKNQAFIGASLSIPYWDYGDYFTISPSTNYAASEDKMWLISNFNTNSGGSGFVKIFNMTGTATAPLLNLGNTINVGTAWGQPADASQAGTTLKVKLGDRRIQSAVYRNGVLWYSQGIGLPAAAPTYSSIQMVALNPNTGTHIETQRIGDATGAIGAGFPWIAINADNDICIGYNTFYATGYPSCAVSFRRNGTSGFESYVYKSGEDWKILERYGDYSSCYVDPEDDRTFWVSTEYARNDNGTIDGTNLWGTWWAKVCTATCINDQTVTGIVGANFLKKYEVNNTITATIQINAGANVKFDAGSRITLSPGFRAQDGSKLKVYVEGCGGTQ